MKDIKARNQLKEMKAISNKNKIKWDIVFVNISSKQKQTKENKTKLYFTVSKYDSTFNKKNKLFKSWDRTF